MKGHTLTSDGLEIRCQDKHFDELEAQGCVVVFPDDGRDEQELPIARQQQCFQ